VVGPVDDAAASVIAARAAAVGAPLVWATRGCRIGAAADEDGGQRFTLATPRRDYGELRLALAGDHQVVNAVVAVRVLEAMEATGVAVGDNAVTRALASVEWPGRLQRVTLGDGREAVLDAAHNPAGAAALARWLTRAGAPRPLVFAAMRDKDIPGLLTFLLPAVSHVVVTSASNPRTAEPAEIARRVRAISAHMPVEVAATPAEALAHAWAHGPRIVVAGSIFLLADVMKELGRS
jgi:dihydrofolate synthase/folylpolyglutamate synthase